MSLKTLDLNEFPYDWEPDSSFYKEYCRQKQEQKEEEKVKKEAMDAADHDFKLLQAIQAKEVAEEKRSYDPWGHYDRLLHYVV